MDILIAIAKEEERKQLKAALDEQGHNVMAITSLVHLRNLLGANYSVGYIVADNQLDGYTGTQIIEKVGFYTPALIIGANNRFVNFILRKRCFPNATFSPTEVDLRKKRELIHAWLDTNSQSSAPKQKRA